MRGTGVAVVTSRADVGQGTMGSCGVGESGAGRRLAMTRITRGGRRCCGTASSASARIGGYALAVKVGGHGCDLVSRQGVAVMASAIAEFDRDLRSVTGQFRDAGSGADRMTP